MERFWFCAMISRFLEIFAFLINVLSSMHYWSLFLRRSCYLKGVQGEALASEGRAGSWDYSGRL